MKAQLSSLALFISLILGTPRAHADGLDFSDNFNRPDSATVGNGWLYLAGNPTDPGIVANQLQGAPGGDGGIYRGVEFDKPLRVHVTCRRGAAPAYNVRVGIRSAGGLEDGYRVVLQRTSSSSSDSRISLYDGAVLIGTQNSSIAFGADFIAKIIFFPDGQVRGEIENAGDDFHFSFGAHAIQSLGSNLSVAFSSGTTTLAALDDVEIEHLGTVAPPTVLWQQASPWRMLTPPALADNGTFIATAGSNSGLGVNSLPSQFGALAFSSETGAAIWGPVKPLSASGVNKFALYGISVTAGSAGKAFGVHDAADFASAGKGSVSALNIADGSVSFTKDLGTANSLNPRMTPPLNESAAQFHYGSDRLAGARTGSGINNWTSTTGLPIGARGAAIDSAGNVYWGTYSTSTSKTRIVSLTSAGVTRWSKELNGTQVARVRAIVGAMSGTTVTGEKLLIYDTTNNRLQAWSLADGAVLWTKNNLDRPVCDAAGIIYAGEVEGRNVVAMNPDGTEIWRVDLPDVDLESDGERVAVDFVDSTGHLYVRFSEHLYCLNTADGSHQWLFDSPDDIYDDTDNDGNDYAPRLAQGGRIFFRNRGDTWYLLDTHLDYAPSAWAVAIYGNRRHTCKSGQFLPLPVVGDPPAVVTDEISDLTQTTVILHGTATPGTRAASVWFEYGTAENLGSTTAVQTIPAGGATAFQATLTGLLPNVKYYWRAVASNPSGTVVGETKSFTPPVFEPKAITLDATDIGTNSGTLNGSVNPGGLSTTVVFQWGTSASYSATTDPITITGTTFATVSVPLTGLALDTTYHFRVVATNSSGVAYGADMEFTTNAIPPDVTTLAATAIGIESATLNGTVDANGAASTTYFEYGADDTYGSTAPAQPVTGDEPAPISATITGLARGATYHFRAVAVNSGGTRHGEDLTFSTEPNHAPVATDDTIYTRNKKVLTFSVLGNDSDPDGDTLAVTSFTAPHNGVLTLTGTTFTYRPILASFLDADDFTYTVSDGHGGTATASVRILNPFYNLAGSYPAALTLGGEPAGYFRINITRSGSFTGFVRLDGREFGARGYFGAGVRGLIGFDGNITLTFTRAPLPPLTVAFHLDVENATPHLAGTITDGTTTVALDANRTIYNRTHPSPQSGKYTMLIAAPGDSALPGGDGWATIRITKYGAAKIIGRLGDGRPLSFAATQEPDGTLPVYATPYNAAGGPLTGTFTFADLPGSDFTGALEWTKPANAADTHYPAGFSTTVQATGSKFLPASRTRPLLPGMTLALPRLALEFSGADFTTPLLKNVTIGAVNFLIVENPGPDNLTGSVSGGIGQISGNITLPGGGIASYTGVVLQKQNRGGGVFIGGTTTGRIAITPR